MIQCKVAFQDPDSGHFEINKLGSDGAEQSLTAEEYEKLQALTPNVSWITITWVRPVQKIKPIKNGNTNT